MEGRYNEFTLAEALEIAKRNDPGEKVPSVSRTLIAEINRLSSSRDFYARRCEALQVVQDKMRDPERKAVCDILANGSTTALDPVDRSHEYAKSKEHGGCSQCGYPEWEPWHHREVGANT